LKNLLIIKALWNLIAAHIRDQPHSSLETTRKKPEVSALGCRMPLFTQVIHYQRQKEVVSFFSMLLGFCG
jgi:hypothetical protein